jgi:putative nucleotidyltransferase with HDIG domain
MSKITSGLNPKTLSKIKDDTISRCEMVAITDELLNKYSPVSPEQIHLLYDATKVNFPIYMQVDDILVQYIKPEEFSKSLVQNLLAALTKKGDNVGIYVEEIHKDMLLNIQSHVRKKKINELFVNNPNMDKRVMMVFDQISNASQMVVKGGISNEVVQKIKVSTASAIDQLLDNPKALGTLSKMIEHDHTLYDHSAMVAMLSASIASDMTSHNFSRSDFSLISLCGLYHDVGKTCIPSHILNKPGSFEPEEYEVMKTHAELGEKHLCSLKDDGHDIHPLVIRVAGEHHEKFDGSGYPKGNTGRLEEREDGIHLFSRIVSIADVYSALLMERVYKPAFDPSKSLEIMIKLSNHYDPDIFKNFVKKVLASINELNKQDTKGRIFTKNDGEAPILFKKAK